MKRTKAPNFHAVVETSPWVPAPANPERLERTFISLTELTHLRLTAFVTLAVDANGMMHSVIQGVEPAHAQAILDALPTIQQQLKNQAQKRA
jgi:hypothetical protein